jgi:hypothetical protein
MLDLIDATGTTVPVIPLGPGVVELDLDAEAGARQAPAIRFLARADGSRSVQIAVAEELWDQAGNALPTAVVAPHSIMASPITPAAGSRHSPMYSLRISSLLESSSREAPSYSILP